MFSPARPPAFDDFDCIIVGSDEVWNFIHPWYGDEPLFFGGGLKPKRLISYAPSFGNYNATQGLPSEWAARLRRFDRVSVRDYNSAQIVRDALGVEPAMVLDPCLQFFPKTFAQAPRPAGSEYLLVYATRLAPGFVHEVQQWARARRLRIVSMGCRQSWADISLPAAGPEEFLRGFQGARAVVTSFFHGCVFSLRFQRPFVAQVPDHRANKVNGLLRTVGAPERLIGNESSLRPGFLDEPLSGAVLAEIERHRKTSSDYLEEALVA